MPVQGAGSSAAAAASGGDGQARAAGGAAAAANVRTPSEPVLASIRAVIQILCTPLTCSFVFPSSSSAASSVSFVLVAVSVRSANAWLLLHEINVVCRLKQSHSQPSPPLLYLHHQPLLKTL